METTRVVVIALLVGLMASAISGHPQNSGFRQSLRQRVATRTSQRDQVRRLRTTTTTETPEPIQISSVLEGTEELGEPEQEINQETGYPVRLDFVTKFVPTKDDCSGALDRLEDEDLDAVIDDKQLVESYKECLLAGRDAVKETCSCVGWELRRIMSGLLTPNLCREGFVLPYCPTDAQRKKGESFMKYISRVDNQSWKDFVKKYGGKGSKSEQLNLPKERRI